MLTILLIRHGETAWNAEKRLQGHLDVGLNATGLQQVAALGQALQDTPLDCIISSDLLRATQTAQAVAHHHALPVSLDAGLRERCFGIFEGLLYADLAQTDAVAHAAWKARDMDARYPAGVSAAETLREFSQRALGTIARLAACAQDHGHRTIALITHGGVLDCAHRDATGTALQQPRDFEIRNASVNRMLWDAGRLQILTWAEVGHLQQKGRDELAC